MDEDQIWIGNYRTIQKTIDELISKRITNTNGTDKKIWKGLYQNILLESASYFSNKKFPLENKKMNEEFCCIICKEEIVTNKKEDNIVFLGCSKSEGRHDQCCTNCGILFFLNEFDRIIGEHHGNNDCISFEHMLMKIMCPMCRNPLGDDSTCNCEEHRKKRCLEDIRKTIIPNVLQNIETISKQHSISTPYINDLLMAELRSTNSAYIRIPTSNSNSNPNVTLLLDTFFLLPNASNNNILPNMTI